MIIAVGLPAAFFIANKKGEQLCAVLLFVI
jgi:hypothetical protein